MLQLRPEDTAVLRQAMHHGAKAHIRRKATAVWNLAQGRSLAEVSSFLDVSQVSLRAWLKRFQESGVQGFSVRPGRGRPTRADGDEIEALLHQSPRMLGFPQTRWTLTALARAAASLNGFSPEGVRQALHRYGFHYKRGQPHLHSPDEEYSEKRDAWSERFEKSEIILKT